MSFIDIHTHLNTYSVTANCSMQIAANKDVCVPWKHAGGHYWWGKEIITWDVVETEGGSMGASKKSKIE